MPNFRVDYFFIIVCLFDEQEVDIVCENVFEVKNYPTTAFVFELAPETNVGSLARLVLNLNQ